MALTDFYQIDRSFSGMRRNLLREIAYLILTVAGLHVWLDCVTCVIIWSKKLSAGGWLRHNKRP